ncbi:TRNA(His) guanylyltransferase [Colletotrichum shisoi]|uniref:tRNA(His) guanylyltransferase n=1 Tax=Colletotrichum shisoi TaxID=2078593 RepID=A0A5Q4BLY0_9PEZI|nr:TRNA(His) guanylyltransferase [Colletotrichum shisoi]
MANSKFEYVKSFEQPDFLLPNTWIVVRVDGRGFTKLCAKYNFEKPNDKRALDLMNAAARVVVTELSDITIAYGVSDEYSFVFHKSCTLFERRASKIVSTVVSMFTANYVHLWSTYFTDTPLSPPLPSFDGRAGTVSGDKNEILFSQFKINYNNEPEMYKKGSVVFRDYELVEPGTHNAAETADALAEPEQQSKTQAEKDKKKRSKARVVIEHLDIIKDDFWDRRPWLLSNKPGKTPKEP